MPEIPSILVVDDDEANLTLLEHVLEDAECRVVRARDGLEALQRLAGMGRCDAILLDRRMPLMDGMEVLRQLKAEPSYRAIPVVMQSVLESKREIKQAMDAGACTYLVKPYRDDVLLGAVKEALGGGEKK